MYSIAQGSALRWCPSYYSTAFWCLFFCCILPISDFFQLRIFSLCLLCVVLQRQNLPNKLRRSIYVLVCIYMSYLFSMHRRSRLKAIAVVNLLFLCYTKAWFWFGDELKHAAMNLNICVICVTESLFYCWKHALTKQSCQYANISDLSSKVATEKRKKRNFSTRLTWGLFQEGLDTTAEWRADLQL